MVLLKCWNHGVVARVESKRLACTDVGIWDQVVSGDRHMGHSVRERAQSGRVAWWLQGVNTAVGSASRGPERESDE